jgi:hypothetical protein
MACPNDQTSLWDNVEREIVMISLLGALRWAIKIID